MIDLLIFILTAYILSIVISCIGLIIYNQFFAKGFCEDKNCKCNCSELPLFVCIVPYVNIIIPFIAYIFVLKRYWDKHNE